MLYPIKSPSDKNNYLIFEHDSGLKLLLIQHGYESKKISTVNDEPKCYAHAIVNAGAINEPSDYFGLAHMLEHAVFLGSKQFPDEEEFENFISKNGGSNNGTTYFETTHYMMDIKSDAFEEGLLRFLSLIFEPTLEPKSFMNELGAIEDEFQISYGDSGSKHFQLLTSSFQDGKYSRFTWGNEKSLKKFGGKDLKIKLQDFHSKYYKPDNIVVGIMCKSDVQECKILLERVLSKIPIFNQEKVNFPDFNNKQVKLEKQIEFDRCKISGIFCSEPVSNYQKTLYLNFCLPKEFHPYTESRPFDFLCHLFSKQYEGNLIHKLKKENLILNGSASYGYNDTCTKEFNIFTLEFDLTKQGLESIPKIIEHIFSFINYLKKAELSAELINLSYRMSSLEYKYIEDQDDLEGYLENLCENVNNQKGEKSILSYYSIESETNISQIHSVINSLFEAVRIGIVVNKSFWEEKGVELDLKEEWLGQNYHKVDPNTSNKFLQEILKISSLFDSISPGDFNLFYTDQYLPKDFQIFGSEDNCETLKSPVKCENTKNLVELWTYKDNKNMIPLQTVDIAFLFSLSGDSVKESQNLTFLLEYLDELFSKSFDYELFCGNYSFGVYKLILNGFRIQIFGFSDKIHEVVNNGLDLVFKGEIDDDIYELTKEKLIENLIFDLTENSIIAEDLFRTLIIPQNLSRLRKIDFLRNQLSKSDLDLKMKDIINPQTILAFSSGNISPTHKDEISNILDKYSQNLKSDSIYQRLVRIPTQDCSFILKSRNEFSKVNYVLVSYHIGEYSLEEVLRLKMANIYVTDKMFNSLRTKKQIGYIAGSFTRIENKELFICLECDSSHKTSNEIIQEIEKFIENIMKIVKKVSDDDINDIRNGLISNMLDIPNRILTKADRIWDEIYTREFEFERTEKQVEFLTKNFSNDEFREYISSKLFSQCKITISVDKIVNGEKEKEIYENIELPAFKEKILETKY